jgi:hypothetical protein
MRPIILSIVAAITVVAVCTTPRTTRAQIIPTAVITPDELEFPDTLVGETSQAMTFTVTKTQSVLPLYIFSASLADSTDFALVSDRCSGRTLYNGQSCQIGVTFSPDETARFVTTMIVIDLGRNIVDTAGVSGQGVAPEVTLSTTSINFGDQTVNVSSSPYELLIINSGSADLHVSSISASGDFTQTDDCDTPVVPGDSCTSEITFTPTAVGAATGTLTITDDAADSPQTVALQGTGIAPGQPDISLSTHELDFGSQPVGTASNAKLITLSSVGTVDLNIVSIVAGGEFSQTNDCSAAVAPGGECTINAVFEPTTAGDLTGTITITDDATDSPQTVSLKGDGVSPDEPHMDLSATSLDFGDQTIDVPSDAQTVTLTNDGTADITGDSSEVTGEGAHSFSVVDNCSGETVEIGDSCNVEVIFNPTVDGVLGAVLSITNNANDSPQTVTLAGTGTGGGTGSGGCSLIRRK